MTPNPEQSERHTNIDAGGVVFVLPRGEAKRVWAKVLEPYDFGVTARFTSFGFGIDALRHGMLIQIGPFYLFGAHIDRYLGARAGDGA